MSEHGEHESHAGITAEIRARAGAWMDDKLKQYDERLADRLEAAHKREVATTKESLAVGNSGDCAKLREALGKLRAELWNNTVIAGKRKFELYEIADAALAAPPRNCDVGTAEEQSKRKMEFCYNQGGCFNCPFGKSETLTLCALAWTQMPYEEGGAK